MRIEVLARWSEMCGQRGDRMRRNGKIILSNRWYCFSIAALKMLLHEQNLTDRRAKAKELE